MSWDEAAIRLAIVLYLITGLRAFWCASTWMRLKAIGDALNAECSLILHQIQLEKAKRGIPDRCMSCGRDIPTANDRHAEIEAIAPSLDEPEQP